MKRNLVAILVFLAMVSLAGTALAGEYVTHVKERWARSVNGQLVTVSERETSGVSPIVYRDRVVRKYVAVPVADDCKQYVVVKGDTLDKIAKSFGTTRQVLLALNPAVKNPNRIKIGQVLKVPAPYAETRLGKAEATSKTLVAENADLQQKLAAKDKTLEALNLENMDLINKNSKANIWLAKYLNDERPMLQAKLLAKDQYISNLKDEKAAVAQRAEKAEAELARLKQGNFGGSSTILKPIPVPEQAPVAPVPNNGNTSLAPNVPVGPETTVNSPAQMMQWAMWSATA